MSRPRHIALYPGSFDGLTRGHLDIIERGAALFDLLHVAVAQNDNKRPFFTVEERLALVREETARIPNVECSTFLGLTMDYAEKIGATYVIRGIRVVSDFDYELQMAMMNRALNPRVETLFMTPSAEHLYTSSSIIKEVLTLGADVGQFVPPATERAMRAKLGLNPTQA